MQRFFKPIQDGVSKNPSHFKFTPCNFYKRKD